MEVFWKSPANLNESSCCLAIRMDEPEVRRVGFASFALLPPSRARAPFLLWGRGSSGSGGGLCAMLEKPKFVPMARPYASDTPIILCIYKSRLRKLCPLPRPRGQIRPLNGQDQYMHRIGAWATCANFGVLRSSVWRPLAGRCGGLSWKSIWNSWSSPGGLLEVSWKSLE